MVYKQKVPPWYAGQREAWRILVLQNYEVFLEIQIIKGVYLHKHLHPVHLEYAHVAELPDFVGVQQLHSSCAFVEVVAEGDAAAPVLDFAGARPEG